ncbi:hypothetical protein TNIN_493241 [Trichonephila inaurata madagascariensis]|uniref:Uncharacterized protein n=1 Tax=Trichonephila inaurata madagascariensis TaxID=2747483 RepID=A0A8X7CM71_9ARAC|nr:hypothetical protein TNIN_493241 [Trichonephila inaurata madagascariensis]
MDSTSHSTYDGLYHVECMTELGEPEDILDYFAFSIENARIHGLLKKPSPTPSLAEDEYDEPPSKRSYDLHSTSSSSQQ